MRARWTRGESMSEDGDDTDVTRSIRQPDSRALEVTLAESRRTLDKQLNHLQEIDDKAMRTVRTAVIVVGFVVSALGIASPSSVIQLQTQTLLFSASGVALLTVAAIMGVATYSVTDVPLGIGPSYREEVQVGGYTNREWTRELFTGYDRWAEELTTEIARNRDLLNVAQILLVAGLFCLLASGIRLALRYTGLTWIKIAAVFALAFGAAVILLRFGTE